MVGAVNGFKPVRLASVLRHDEHHDIALVLEDAQSTQLALVLDRGMAENLHSAILQHLPQGDGEEFGVTLAADLQAVELIDHVDVTRANPSKFELDFQAAGHSRFKLRLSWGEAVRMMHRLRGQIADRIRETSN